MTEAAVIFNRHTLRKMRARSYFLSTLKEAPADADVISQQYMIRAGMIKKLAAGVYTYMPVGLRTIRKIEKIIREEMDRAGAIELLSFGRNPVVGRSTAPNFSASRIVMIATS